MDELISSKFSVAELEGDNDSKMCYFRTRLETFKINNWPHGDDESCNAEKVLQSTKLC